MYVMEIRQFTHFYLSMCRKGNAVIECSHDVTDVQNYYYLFQ